MLPNNILTDNKQNYIQSLIYKCKLTPNQLSKEEIQAFYSVNAYDQLSKHHLQQAKKANELKDKYHNLFHQQVQKNFLNFVKKYTQNTKHIEQLKSVKNALQDRLNEQCYGYIKNFIYFVVNHRLENASLSALQIAYICNTTVRYVQKVLAELKQWNILYRYRLKQAEINANKKALKGKYYITKLCLLDDDQKNWMFQDKKFWRFKQFELKEFFIETEELKILIANIDAENLTEADYK